MSGTVQTPSQYVFQPSGGGDILHFKDANGNIVSWVDAAGAGQGALAGGIPQFASYVFSVTGGVVSAKNNVTGQVDFSGSDAAVVINTVLAANATVGGTLYFKNGIYNINSLVQETVAGWTNYFYGIGIPSNPLSTSVNWIFEGESRPTWTGEFSQNVVPTNGVIFNVTAAALLPLSGSNIAVGVWQRPDPTIQFANDDFFRNIGVRFPSNQRGNTIHIGMYNSNSPDYDNVLCDWAVSNFALSVLSLPPTTSFGLTSSYSSADNIQHFKNTYVSGCGYGYDIQSEHVVADTITSIYCTNAGIIGRSGTAIFHPCVFIKTTDQENANGWQLGPQMVLGSRVDFIGYDIEFATSGTFNRLSNFTESTPGNTNGLITMSAVQQFVGVANNGSIFSGTGGQNFTVWNSGKVHIPGILKSSATSAATTGTTKQTLSSFITSIGPQNAGSIFTNNLGAVVRVKAWGITAANANNKTLTVDFGGTTIASVTSAVSGGVLKAEADILVVANNSQECMGTATDGTAAPTLTRTAATVTSASAITIAATATTPTASGDFTLKGFTVEYLVGHN